MLSKVFRLNVVTQAGERDDFEVVPSQGGRPFRTTSRFIAGCVARSEDGSYLRRLSEEEIGLAVLEGSELVDSEAWVHRNQPPDRSGLLCYLRNGNGLTWYFAVDKEGCLISDVHCQRGMVAEALPQRTSGPHVF